MANKKTEEPNKSENQNNLIDNIENDTYLQTNPKLNKMVSLIAKNKFNRYLNDVKIL